MKKAKAKYQFFFMGIETWLDTDKDSAQKHAETLISTGFSEVIWGPVVIDESAGYVWSTDDNGKIRFATDKEGTIRV